MTFKDKFSKIVFVLITLFCVAIAPIVLAEEVVAASNSYENQVLNLVNQERLKAGVAPLEMDNELFDAAKIRSKEIKTYFSHTRPDGSSCFSISPKLMGENIAWGQRTPKEVMKTWMNSPPHRSNILDPSFKSMGVGYFKKGSSYWVQLFSDKKAVGEIKKPKAPSFSLNSGKKKIEINWNKVSGASGYQIYRSTNKNGKFEVKKTLKNGNTHQYTDKNLKKRIYYYRIKSYTVIGGKREFSNFSPIKSMTPK